LGTAFSVALGLALRRADTVLEKESGKTPMHEDKNKAFSSLKKLFKL
jgi:hypothetical protein